MFVRLKAQSCEAQTAAGLISYSLSRSPRRKNLTIYVKEDRHVRVLAPLLLGNKHIERFIQKKAHWIVRSLERLAARFPKTYQHSFRDGEEFLFLGQSYRLCYVPSDAKRIKMSFNGSRFEALVPISMSWEKIEESIKKALVVWYKVEAKRTVEERLPVWTKKLDLKIERVVVRTQKRIWGSCYYRLKRININWKIVMMPLKVVDYILIHELCHFYVANHSKRFWDKVRSIDPHYKVSEQWLKEYEAMTRLT